jgi:hypothetical protein
LIPLNGSRPACDLQNGPRIDLLASKIDPSHKPTSEKNQAPLQPLAERQARWLTRRCPISKATALALAPLVFEEVRA